MVTAIGHSGSTPHNPLTFQCKWCGHRCSPLRPGNHGQGVIGLSATRPSHQNVNEGRQPPFELPWAASIVVPHQTQPLTGHHVNNLHSPPQMSPHSANHDNHSLQWAGVTQPASIIHVRSDWGDKTHHASGGPAMTHAAAQKKALHSFRLSGWLDLLPCQGHGRLPQSLFKTMRPVVTSTAPLRCAYHLSGQHSYNAFDGQQRAVQMMGNGGFSFLRVTASQAEHFAAWARAPTSGASQLSKG